MPRPDPLALREAARIVGTEIGTAHAHQHGRDDWNKDDLAAAESAERAYLARHAHDDPEGQPYAPSPS